MNDKPQPPRIVGNSDNYELYTGQERLSALYQTDLMDRGTLRPFDAVGGGELVVPVALVSLVATERQFFKKHVLACPNRGRASA